jgi:hypothetical protein
VGIASVVPGRRAVLRGVEYVFVGVDDRVAFVGLVFGERDRGTSASAASASAGLGVGDGRVDVFEAAFGMGAVLEHAAVVLV